MSNVKYINLRELFNSKIFRIPDYQRGYSWEDKHFEALWSDLHNIQLGKLEYHYTGMITVASIQPEVYKEWSDNFYFKHNKGYFVVDGQQRLTTITILLFELVKAYFQPENPNNKLLDGVRKEYWIKNYLIRNEDDEHYPCSFVFGYHTDNPSDRFFKVKILEQTQYASDDFPIEETAYTNQLIEAKKFFRKKIQGYINIEAQNSSIKGAFEKLEDLCQLLVERMMFDFKILDNALDIFMVFETMNTRGKGLSDLEKLKNRLIYLATLLKNMPVLSGTNSETSIDLRNHIVQVWKDIYKELGRSKALLNTDNTLLNYHWIMYHGYDRNRAKAYAEDLFDQQFTVENVVDQKQTGKSIAHYVNSLIKSARWWYVLSNPDDSIAMKYTNDIRMTQMLIRIHRLKYRYFIPLLFAGLESSYESLETKRKFLEEIERYIFLIFVVSSRRAHTGSSHFSSQASNLYKREDGWDLDSIISDIDEWVSGGEGFYGYFQWSNFKQYLEPSFEHDHLNGYKDWSGLKYFLAEYQSRTAPLTEYSEYKVVPIFSRGNEGTPKKMGLKDIAGAKLRYLERSLGNYTLVRKPPQDWNTFSFEQIKNYLREHQEDSDLLDYPQWDAHTIASRGKKMLQFMQERWQIASSQHLSEAEQLDLLYLNFMQDL